MYIYLVINLWLNSGVEMKLLHSEYRWIKIIIGGGGDANWFLGHFLKFRRKNP